MKKLQKVLLEFTARLIMNAIKLVIGLSLGIAAISTQYHTPAMTGGTAEIVFWVVALLAVVISAIETWQDWEFVPEKKEAA